MVNMPVEVREAGPGDVSALIEAYLASWRVACAGLLPEEVLNEQESVRRKYDWRGAIESCSSIVLVAHDGNVVVGMLQAVAKAAGRGDLPEGCVPGSV